MTPHPHLKPDGVYLLSHSIGLLPRAAEETVLQVYFDPWRENPADAWTDWLVAVEGFRKALARLFNHAPKWFCPQPNVSAALSKILHALPVEPRRPAVLLAEATFPSLGFVIEAARRTGLQPRFLSSQNALDAQAWADAMTPEVGFVLLTHVQSEDGCQQPVADVLRETSSRGIVSIVDVAQSAGVVPIDLAEWQADFIIGSSVKWLCGGPGAGFLWVRPERMAGCLPLDSGWFSHEAPFEFDIHSFRPAEDARRFWGGTPSVLPYVVATAGIQSVEASGVAAVQAHNRQLCTRLMEGLEDVAVVGSRDLSNRGGTLVLATKMPSPEAVARLRAFGIHVDARTKGVRVSPHIYTSADEMDVAIWTFREVLAA